MRHGPAAEPGRSRQQRQDNWTGVLEGLSLFLNTEAEAHCQHAGHDEQKAGDPCNRREEVVKCHVQLLPPWPLEATEVARLGAVYARIGPTRLDGAPKGRI